MRIHALYIALMALIIALAIAWPRGYSDGWMDGYRHRQIEQLPAPGIERHKRPADLLGKG
jgi:hypothetical protein